MGHSLTLTDRHHGELAGGVRLKDALRIARRCSSPSEPIESIAVLLGEDRLLEHVWAKRGRLGQQLELAGFSSVVTPGFSTYWNDTPFASVVSIARSAQVAVALARHLPTIPTIVWRYHEDLDRWAAWIAAGEVETICLDLGPLAPASWFSWGLDAARYLSEACRQIGGTTPRLLAHGPFTLERFAAVHDAWRGPVTFASQQPWSRAIHGRELDAQLNNVIADVRAPTTELLEVNAHNFEMAARQSKLELAAVADLKRSA